MKKLIFLFTILILFSTSIGLNGQDSVVEFKPSGKPILTVFANLHSGIKGNTDAAWEIRRAYLGYEYNISKHFYSQIKVDIGSPDDISQFSNIRRYAYFKNAMVRYTNKNLKIDVGLIDMQHFIMQEKFWGYRYIARSFNDRYKFGPKADLGIDVRYKFCKVVEADFTFSNGEGYTQLQRDNTFRVAFGVNLYPVKGLSMRLYYDIMDKSVATSTISTFMGYKFKDIFRIGGELNVKLNKDYVQDHNQMGYSIYGTYIILKGKLEVFARYDWLRSNILEGEDIPWNLPKDGSSVVAGIQYQPHKMVKLALDYQDVVGAAENGEDVAFIFLNIQFKL